MLRPLNGFNSGTKVNQIISDLLINFLEKSNKISKKHDSKLNNFEVKLLNMGRTNSIKNTIKNKFRHLEFYNKNKSFAHIINNYKMSIHFFLGTPFIESLYYNKPCILILKREIHMNFDQQFNSILNKLKKANICFEDVNKAAKFFNANEKSLYEWWESNKVQKIRKLYCDKYCRNFKSKKDLLKKIFI